VIGTDLYPTIFQILGHTGQISPRVEGGSLRAHLMSGGLVPVQRSHPFLVFKYTKPNNRHDLTIVQGSMKLLKDVDSGQTFLYDLDKDIGENEDLSSKKPELADRLYRQMTAYFKNLSWDESRIPNSQ
jgi:hypothetical protein